MITSATKGGAARKLVTGLMVLLTVTALTIGAAAPAGAAAPNDPSSVACGPSQLALQKNLAAQYAGQFKAVRFHFWYWNGQWTYVGAQDWEIFQGVGPSTVTTGGVQTMAVPSGIYWRVATESYLWNGTAWDSYAFVWANHSQYGVYGQQFCWT